MTSSSISATDIALLIESAAKSGVQTLKLGDLEISFPNKNESEQFTTVSNHNATSPLAADSVGEASEIDEEDRQNIEELRLAELMISDPLAYEELLGKEGAKGHETEANV